MWNLLTITISVSGGQIYDYKQLPSNTKIGDLTKTDRYCEVCQGYLPFSDLVWWYVILVVIVKILKILKLYIPLSESPHFPDALTCLMSRTTEYPTRMHTDSTNDTPSSKSDYFSFFHYTGFQPSSIMHKHQVVHRNFISALHLNKVYARRCNENMIRREKCSPPIYKGP